MKLTAFMCAIGLFFGVKAVHAVSSYANAVHDSDALNILLQRSDLPLSELQSLLSNCNASQQSMYFCAWRDEIVSAQAFSRTVLEKSHQWSTCGKALDAWVSQVERARDQQCEAAARQEFGEGSMRPTAQLLCAAQTTKRLNQRLAQMRGCEELSDHLP